MKIKTAVIGLGRIGSQWDEGVLRDSPRTHVGAILKNEQFELSAVCDINRIHRNKFIENWKLQIPIYDSVKEMLKNSCFDVVTVAVPTTVHQRILKDVLKSCPKVVFIEKPFCSSFAEANEIYCLAKELNVVLAVNYHRRWDEKIHKLKIMLDTMKSIPSHVNILYRKGLLNYGSHIVNLLLYLFGSIESVLSEPIRGASSKLEDPSISSILYFKSGLQVTMKGLDDVNYELFDIDIYYPNRKFRIEMGGYIIEVYDIARDLYYKDYMNLKIIEGLFPKREIYGMVASYKEIEEYILYKKPCNTNSAEIALQTLKVLDAIRGSAMNQHAINI